MCFGGNKAARMAAAEAERQRAEELERQARITAGAENIEGTFSQFDDSFYKGLGDNYTNYAMPQLDDQFTTGMKELRLALASKGLQNSSEAAQRYGKLKESYDTQLTSIADKARGYENTAKGNINSAKDNLLTQNLSLANPALASQSAINSAALNSQLPTYDPLANAFANATAGLSTYADLSRRGQAQPLSSLFKIRDTSRIVS